MPEEQLILPLDERFRNAEQYAFDFEEPKKKEEPPHADWFVCIGNCNICPRCDNSNNR